MPKTLHFLPFWIILNPSPDSRLQTPDSRLPTLTQILFQQALFIILVILNSGYDTVGKGLYILYNLMDIPDAYYYFLPQPPYFLLVVGLFTGITCGLAFEATLKQWVKVWMQTANQNDPKLIDSPLLLPFLGICVGICVFLSSGLEIFILNRWISYAIALPITIFIAGLIWQQLGQLLQQLKAGGSKAIDLDAF